MTKKFFMKQIENIIGDKDFVVLSNIIQGQMRGASKKRLKSFEVAFTNDCFKKPDTIMDLMSSSIWGLLVMKKKFIPNETIKNVIKSEKEYDKK